MGDRPPPSGPLVEGTLYLLGEDVLEKLKMLGYEAEFVDEKGYRPFSCVEFVTERKSGLVGMPTAVCNTAPQWGIFEELVEWLMAKCGSTFMKDQCVARAQEADASYARPNPVLSVGGGGERARKWLAQPSPLPPRTRR